MLFLNIEIWISISIIYFNLNMYHKKLIKKKNINSCMRNFKFPISLNLCISNANLHLWCYTHVYIFNDEITLCIGKLLHVLRHVAFWHVVNSPGGCISVNRSAGTRVQPREGRLRRPVRIRRKLFQGVDWWMMKSRKPAANRYSGNFPRTFNPFDRYINITRSGTTV